jgi:hypothetical protein
MRLYRWLLALCPASLRREYGAAMEETFARRCGDPRASHASDGFRISLGECAIQAECIGEGTEGSDDWRRRACAPDPGFDPTSAFTFSIGLPDRDYPSRDAAVAAHHAILDRLSALPGVTAVSASTCLPLAGLCSGNTLRVEGRPIPPGTIPPLALFRAVAGGYFETMGIRTRVGASPRIGASG